jgi:predicted ester cyclase
MQLQQLPLIILAFAVGGCSIPDDAAMEQEEITSVEQNEAVIRQVLALIDDRKLDEAFELYALDYIYHGPTGELRGRDGIRGLWEVFLIGFPDLHSTIEDMVSEGDKVVLRWRIEGTHTGDFMGFAPSNRKIALGVTEIFRVANGQLVEAWDQFDRRARYLAQVS